MGISEISRALGLNKGTVFNTVYTLTDLNIIENGPDGKFGLGSRLYTLGKTAGKRSELIQTVHPYLEKINHQTKLSAFLGIRSGLKATIVDKVDSAYDLKISSEVGMQIPLIAGAGGKALLSQLDEGEIDAILTQLDIKEFTPNSPKNRADVKKAILETKRTGISVEFEEYIEGVVAFSVPIKTFRKNLQAAIWAVGLKQQIPNKAIPEVAQFLVELCGGINDQFSPVA